MTDTAKYPDISKKEFVKQFISNSGAKSTPNPAAIFMAGLPGAGKTEFSKALVKIVNQKVIRIDMDEIASEIKNYQPEKADLYRADASKLLNGIYDAVLEEHLEFIMDGTFGSKNAIKNIERAIRHNYKVKVIYIEQDPKLAWRFTLAREKVEHRAIDIDGFIMAYFNIRDNLVKTNSLVEKYDKITIDLIVKDENNRIGSWMPNISIDKLPKNSYNKETLRRHINV